MYATTSRWDEASCIVQCNNVLSPVELSIRRHEQEYDMCSIVLQDYTAICVMFRRPLDILSSVNLATKKIVLIRNECRTDLYGSLVDAEDSTVAPIIAQCEWELVSTTHSTIRPLDYVIARHAR